MPRSTRSRKLRNRASKALLPRHPRNAQRHYERYLELARAEALRGDTVAAENYLQHAEHYLRSMRDNHAADASRREL
ncbi:DUF4167 domain-containing protein [Bradyrhizobium sp. cir1]|uniref:DUF4167 domain-containing protein n=1 Tax=Bradyrhizobium sp. cir1 TaxID=1445730 RepID=UPI0016059C5D|nr:DUF4167 domain-containing protein [Bradyrhizobium sp. cir1]